MSLHASPEWTKESERRERNRLERSDRRLKWLKKQLKQNEVKVQMSGDDESKWVIKWPDYSTL